MTNLTPSEARRLIDKLRHNQAKEHGISILEEKYLAALEIALTVLEQQEKGEMDFIRMQELLKNNQTDTYRQIENDGWKKNEGTQPPPLRGESEIDAKLKDGSIVRGRVEQFYWTLPGLASDVISYREAEKNGWIEWGGGRRPVDEETFVEVKFKDDEYRIALEAWEFDWNHYGNNSDIIAYRVIENDGREG